MQFQLQQSKVYVNMKVPKIQFTDRVLGIRVLPQRQVSAAPVVVQRQVPGGPDSAENRLEVPLLQFLDQVVDTLVVHSLCPFIPASRPMGLWPRSSSTTVACSWLVLLVMMRLAPCSVPFD